MTIVRPLPEAVAAEHPQLVADIDRSLLVHGGDRSALLPVLQDVVRLHGAVSDVAVQVVAHRLGVPTVEVLGVVSFYSFLHGGNDAQTDPAPGQDAAPRHVVRLCRTLSCELAGAGETAEALRRELDGEERRPGPAGTRLEFVNCIGLCDRPPAMLVDDEAVCAVTPERVTAVVARLHR
ncbi:NAD(P)H-dependent oxidoreductase subunit E [Intrasporangium sp.]|uniref:NADH-quinone oxidoreductase subunit NuoE family protein n=1 Tax=Intrasporangium sp. TaxID=1925024 RepID=UPI002939EFF5|nr:NAD(P)H-dependent oxidoreductase subunit E [Intrasporangium sp.]MDV3221117.1 NAD(P)H-dependent oxidoreductase subunit E [Intrasporangium sp.]